MQLLFVIFPKYKHWNIEKQSSLKTNVKKLLLLGGTWQRSLIDSFEEKCV